MSPPAPRWLDEPGHPVPTIPCHPTAAARRRFRLHGRHLWRDPAWRPFQVEAHPSWCGHAVPRVYVPEGGEWWRQMPLSESQGAEE